MCQDLHTDPQFPQFPTHVGIQRFDSISRSLGDDRKKAIDSLVETAEKLHRATVQTDS
jgi:hypothetical protein